VQPVAAVPGHDGNEVHQAGGNLILGDRLRHLGKRGRDVPADRVDLGVQDLHLSLEPAGLDPQQLELLGDPRPVGDQPG
jgi:hypothetical protein